MKLKTAAVCAVAAALVIAPITSASAHERFSRNHDGSIIGLLAAGAAIAVGTALLTAPASALPPPAVTYYPPPPVYYAPPRVYHAAPRAYHRPRMEYRGRR